jgi:hypothetical protein
MEHKNQIDGKQDTVAQRKEKTVLIQGMLFEMGMTDRDLIELINSILQLGKGQTAEIEEQNIVISEQVEIEVQAQEAELEDAQGRFRGKIKNKELWQFLNIEKLKNLSLRANFAANLNKLRQLGAEPDHEKISQLTGIKNITKLNLDGTALNSNGDKTRLDINQISKVNNYLDKELSRYNERQFQQQKSPEKSKSLMGRLVDGAKSIAQGASDKLKSKLEKLDYQFDMARLKETAKKAELANSTIKRFENKIQQRFPQINNFRYKDGNVFISTRSDPDRFVNLKDFLDSIGELKNFEKEIDDAGSASSALKEMLKELKQSLGVDSLKFAKDGRLMIQEETKGLKKTIHISDYLSDIKNIQKLKQDRKDSARLNLSRHKDIDDEEIAEEREYEEFRQEELEHSGEEKETNVDKSKDLSKQVKKDLVKLDVISDQAKRVEGMKELREDLGKYMKDNMKEASKNKDLIKEIEEQQRKGNNKDLIK